MKLCASYHSAINNMDFIDEIRYPIQAMPQMLEAMEKYPSKNYILEILSMQDSNINVDKLIALTTEHNNLIIDCYKKSDFFELKNVAKINQVMYHYPVNTFNDLWYMVQFNPAYIAITEPLTFELMQVKQNVGDIPIRVLPALGRSSEWNNIADKDNGLCHFWIAPHTLDLYNDFIDVLDLYDADVEREQALIQIYYNKQYELPIGTFVKNCESILPTGLIDKNFVENRINCRQTCMLNKCHACKTFERVALMLSPQSQS